MEDVEVWRDIPNYEGFYSASSLGQIRSDRSGRTLRGAVSASDGYTRVMLSVGGVAKCRTVHSLVAEAFLGERPDGYEVNHRDTNKRNNRRDNLEYITGSANMRHASEHRLLRHQRVWSDDVKAIRERFRAGESAETLANEYGLSIAGIRNHTHGLRRSKLTPDDVRQIRQMRRSGLTQQAIADQFGVSQTMVGFIVRRIAWVDVDDNP